MGDAADIQPEAWTQWEFIDALGDGVYSVDPEGRCLFVNKAAVRILGYDGPQDLLGCNMHQTIHHTRPDGSPFPQSECPLLHTATSGHPVRLENEMLWRRDGTPFLAEYSSFPVTSGGRITGSVITFSDSSVRQDAQQRLAVQYAVSQILAGAGSDESLPVRLLEAVGAGLGWDIGLFWRKQDMTPGREVLMCVGDWRSKDAGPAQGFGQDRVGTLLEFAAGLPGKVWIMEAPIHIARLPGDPASPRQAEAARLGLRSAFAFPIMDRNAVVGAIEFYSRKQIDLDESLLEAVSTLGHQIGQTLERRRVLEDMAEAERLKAAILASAPDCVITVDAHARIVEFNVTAERVFGRTAAEVAGHDMAEIVFPPESHAAHRKAFARALEDDPAILGRRIEVNAVHGDGSRFPVEITMSRTSAGARPLFTTYLRDITLRRQEQARLRESAARFRTMANAIPQLAWMTDADGAITWYNQRWYDFTGTTFEEMAGWGWRSVQHPDHIDRVEQRLREKLRGRRGLGGHIPAAFARTARTAGSCPARCPSARSRPTSSPRASIIGWFGTNTDITTMREAEATLAAARDEAEAANRAKSTFIANMSHELRTPLSAIIGYAEMLSEEIEDGTTRPTWPATCSKIEGNARHLLGLINDVLDLSKVESGKMDAFAETFDVARWSTDVGHRRRADGEERQPLDLDLGDATRHACTRT